MSDLARRARALERSRRLALAGLTSRTNAAEAAPPASADTERDRV